MAKITKLCTLLGIVCLATSGLAFAGCPPGMLPGYQPWEFQVCGSGILLSIETGGSSLGACLPLTGHIVVNTAAGKVCDFILDETSELFDSPDSGDELKAKTFYLNSNKGYSDINGLHCFYADRWGQDELEILFPPYTADEFADKVPSNVLAKQIEIDGAWTPM